MSKTYTHVQSIADAVWTINHNLGFKPCVAATVVEAGAVQAILPKAIEYPSDTQVVIRFSVPRTGQARLA
jgi:hypothetical protein